MKASQFRVARPTNQLDKITNFYQHGLGLEVIRSFQDHNGYEGVILGTPNAPYHLEFTQHKDGRPCPAPTKDNLLVFYIPERSVIQEIVVRLSQMGHFVVPPENPYWKKNGVTLEDPDGWRIVLQNSRGLVVEG